MFWLFAMAATAGVILATPVVFQIADTPSADELESGISSFAAFALIAGGLGGLLALAFDPTDLVALVIAVCLGLAGGALHPELLGALRRG